MARMSNGELAQMAQAAEGRQKKLVFGFAAITVHYDAFCALLKEQKGFTNAEKEKIVELYNMATVAWKEGFNGKD